MKTLINTTILVISMFFLYSCEREKDPKNEDDVIDSYLDHNDFIKDGLVAYYPFNGNAQDYSGNQLHGIPHSVTYTTDRYGNADRSCHFDGSGNYIEIRNSSILNQNSYTICFWYRSNAYNDTIERSVISKSDSLKHGYTISIYSSDYFSDLGFTYRDQNTKIEAWHAFGGPNYREWSPETADKYEFAAIAFSENQLIDYLWGLEETHSPSTFFNANEFNIYIGKNKNSQYNCFHGDIDDLLIYDRILTYDEIQKLYDLGIK